MSANKYGSKWIRRKKRLAIYTRDQMRCVYCRKLLTLKQATLDHVLGRAAGNAATNLVTACRRCNELKGDGPVWDWAWPRVALSLSTPLRPC